MTPLPRGAHLMTSWNDRYGRQHRRCSCGRRTPTPGVESGVRAAVTAGVPFVGPYAYQVADALMAPCLEYRAGESLLDRAGRLARRGQIDVALVLLGQVLDVGAGHGKAPGPARVRDAAGAAQAAPRVVPGAGPESTPPPADLDQATPAPASPGPSTPGPAQADSAPPTPPGYQRGHWATCGHWADRPVRHDWSHRHWCPVCEPDKHDDRCPGVRYAQVGQRPLAAVRVRPCAVCGDTATATLYPGGVLCDRHSPWAVAGRPDPRLARAASSAARGAA